MTEIQNNDLLTTLRINQSKMKKNLIVLMLIFPISLLAQNVSYTLKGKIGNVNAPAKVYLVRGNTRVDSTAIQNGQFEFKGTITDPVQASLILSYKGTGIYSRPLQHLDIYLESGIINISSSDSLANAIIKGSKVNADNEKLKTALKPIDEKQKVIMSEYMSMSAEKLHDNDAMADFKARYKVITDDKKQVYLDFINANPNSFMSLIALEGLITLQIIDGEIPEYSELAPLFNSLSSDVKNTITGKKDAKSLVVMKSTAIGEMAPEFTQKDPDGKLIKLSSLKGKYVLVDFWASWCAPCRAESPNVVKAYNKYHEKGFEILSVSLDNEKGKDAWLTAIQKDGLVWKNVSDLKGWKNEVAVLYGIKAIPQNMLLDKTGKIIGKNLKGEALSKKLEEIFN